MATPDGAFNPVTLGSKVLGLVALVALAWCVYEGVSLRLLSAELQTASAPRRVISLSLAPTTAQAQGILTEWGCSQTDGTSCPVARAALSRDTRFIAAYVLALLLIAVWAHVAGGVSPRVVAAMCALVVLAALADLVENRLLLEAIGNGDGAPVAARVFTLARLAAMTKFVLLLGGIAGITVITGGALRLFFGAKRAAQELATLAAAVAGAAAPMTTFSELIERETDGIFQDLPTRPRDNPDCVSHGAADEAFVAFREADIIGLALSGGGIRSATFNLGLLQGLHASHLLRLFDYLATVSGGGYIGAFWSAWLKRLPLAPGDEAWDESLFPTNQGRGRNEGARRDESRVETDQERHLREFSGFLAPRWGFFEVETWTAVVSLMAGLVPALLIGLSVIGMTLIAWLGLTFPLASREPNLAPALAIGAISGLVLWLFERMWQRFKRESAGNTTRQDSAARGRRVYVGFAWLAGAVAVAIQFLLGRAYTSLLDGAWPILRWGETLGWTSAPDANGLVRWWAIAAIDNPGRPWVLSLRLFDYGVAWLLTCFILILLRTMSAVSPRPWSRESLAAFDRALMRVLGTGVVWTGLVLLWHIAVNLPNLASVVIGAAVSGGIFAALRNWIGVSLRRPAEAGMLDRLKPLLPSLLAYFTLVLMAVGVAALLVEAAGTDWYRWWLAAAVMSMTLVLASFISPDEFGLHAFYRDRIARAYAGATNLAPGEGAASNRGSEPRHGDDLPFSSLRSRPLHLVCCAANDLSGDQVETLGRGARSAVLSKHGFSLGQHARGWYPYSPGNRLASGITASAAAFNSNMGHISVRVGPAVSFLMTMLNLRLGLWVRHPLAHMAGFRRWPGLLLYREMLGLTSASGRMPVDEVPKSVLRDIHLSDGAHFENLALYELVRRHCRYILVSDCGADPDVAFDDLGNALRRVREDFGVDIELDVASLRPGPDGQSRQHVAVGTIRYAANDVGILLYVKPTITGDEPPDVLQYRTRNTAFPHEATSDQFYDEAQWESYRRLGLHAAQQIFDFVSREDENGRRSADWVWAEARQRWGATPAGLEDRILEMTKRFGALEAELQQRKGFRLLRDVFPEVRYFPDEVRQVYTPDARMAGPADAAADDATADELIAMELSVLLRVIQLMEDAWASCELDRWWRHPLNLGWINLFARWATSGSFRFWWPIAAPMFSPGFRQFIQQRFPVRDDTGRTALPHAGLLETIETPRDSGLAALWWQRRSTQPVAWERPVVDGFGRTYYQNILPLQRGSMKVRMQAGLAAVTTLGTHVAWTSDDFFVPPSLWGAGIGGAFLLALLDEVETSFTLCHVIVKAPPMGQAYQLARDDRHAFVEQYRKVGFREARPNCGHGSEEEAAMCAALHFDAARDTLLTLDLEMRRRRRQPQMR